MKIGINFGIFFSRISILFLTLTLSLPSSSVAFRQMEKVEGAGLEELNASLETGLEEVDLKVKNLLFDWLRLRNRNTVPRLELLVVNLAEFSDQQRMQFVEGLAWMEPEDVQRFFKDILWSEAPAAMALRLEIFKTLDQGLNQESFFIWQEILTKAEEDPDVKDRLARIPFKGFFALAFELAQRENNLRSLLQAKQDNLGQTVVRRVEASVDLDRGSFGAGSLLLGRKAQIYQDPNLLKDKASIIFSRMEFIEGRISKLISDVLILRIKYGTIALHFSDSVRDKWRALSSEVEEKHRIFNGLEKEFNRPGYKILPIHQLHYLHQAIRFRELYSIYLFLNPAKEIDPENILEEPLRVEKLNQELFELIRVQQKRFGINTTSGLEERSDEEVAQETIEWLKSKDEAQQQRAVQRIREWIVAPLLEIAIPEKPTVQGVWPQMVDSRYIDQSFDGLMKVEQSLVWVEILTEQATELHISLEIHELRPIVQEWNQILVNFFDRMSDSPTLPRLELESGEESELKRAREYIALSQALTRRNEYLNKHLPELKHKWQELSSRWGIQQDAGLEEKKPVEVRPSGVRVRDLELTDTMIKALGNLGISKDTPIEEMEKVRAWWFDFEEKIGPARLNNLRSELRKYNVYLYREKPLEPAKEISATPVLTPDQEAASSRIQAEFKKIRQISRVALFGIGPTEAAEHVDVLYVMEKTMTSRLKARLFIVTSSDEQARLFNRAGFIASSNIHHIVEKFNQEVLFNGFSFVDYYAEASEAEALRKEISRSRQDAKIYFTRIPPTDLRGFLEAISKTISRVLPKRKPINIDQLVEDILLLSKA